MISYETIRDFILAQPDEKPVNMLEGDKALPSGCVLVHYAKAHNIEIPTGVAYHEVGSQSLTVDAADLLYTLTDDDADIYTATTTYKDLKEKTKAYDSKRTPQPV